MILSSFIKRKHYCIHDLYTFNNIYEYNLNNYIIYYNNNSGVIKRNAEECIYTLTSDKNEYPFMINGIYKKSRKMFHFIIYNRHGVWQMQKISSFDRWKSWIEHEYIYSSINEKINEILILDAI